jgi:hypothetical protein
MRVFRQIAEEVRFKRIEWCYHLTMIRRKFAKHNEHFFV